MKLKPRTASGVLDANMILRSNVMCVNQKYIISRKFAIDDNNYIGKYKDNQPRSFLVICGHGCSKFTSWVPHSMRYKTSHKVQCASPHHTRHIMQCNYSVFGWISSTSPWTYNYRQTSIIRRTKFQNSYVSRHAVCFSPIHWTRC